MTVTITVTVAVLKTMTRFDSDIVGYQFRFVQNQTNNKIIRN